MAKRNTTQGFRKALKERYGTKCYICGEEGAELHHLIPLWMGGEDEPNNFIPLCTWHHMLMHKARSMRQGHKSHHGRNRSVAKVEGYKYIIDDYLHCKIGTAECKKALGMTEKTAISDRVWFKEYIKEQGITAYKNNIDVIRSQERSKGHKSKLDVLGWIEYEDGRKEVFDRSALRTPI